MCRRAESRLAARPTAPYEGRRFVAEQCDRLGMTELLDTATLLTSELVTNVVTHTVANPVIVVASTCGQLIVEVRDEDSGWPAEPGDPGAEIGAAAGGRGLTLVSRLAADWGVRQLEGDGKAIWFALRPHDPPPYAASCGCSEPIYDAVVAS